MQTAFGHAVQTYQYDALYRITQAEETNDGNASWIENYDYDRYGNRTTHTHDLHGTALAVNNITRPTIDDTTNRFDPNQGYAYDKVGNLTTDVDEFGNVRINEGGESRFEIHVYDKKGLAAGEDSGTVMGKDGFVTKHGKPARPPKNAPDSVLRNLNRINIGILRRQGKIKPGDPYRSGAYLNNGSSVLKGAVSKMGIITNISGIGSGLIDDYELYERAKKNGVSMAVQFQIENHKKKYISTPFGVFPNDCRTGGLCIQDPTGYE